eukprot:286907_1
MQFVSQMKEPSLIWILTVWLKLNAISAFLGVIVALFCYYKCRTAKETNRWQWIEFHDQEWCPNIFKEWLRRGYLYENVWNHYLGPCKELTQIISKFIDQYNISLILDLCSGSCGPSDIINKTINKTRTNTSIQPVTTIVTDLYPQIASWKAFSANNENLLYIEKSVDATNINMNEISKTFDITENKSMVLRTIFLAFHHFSHKLCVKIFEDVFKNKDMIVITDVTADKSLINFLLFLTVYTIS